MEAKELRIGNWIHYPQTADISRAGYYFGQVSEISEKHNTISIKGYILAANFKLLQCKPIPLTEEWLLKFGFKKNLLNEYDIAGLEFYKSDDTYSLGYNNEYGTQLWYLERKIQFVHQLQNLYFALTGNELTLTPAKEEMK